MILRRHNVNDTVYFAVFLQGEGGEPVGGVNLRADVLRPDGSVVSGIVFEEVFRDGVYVTSLNATDISGYYYVRFYADGFQDCVSWFEVV